MSRSYKQPIIKEGYKSKRKRISKRFASKAVRRAPAVSSGMFYKKFTAAIISAIIGSSINPVAQFLAGNGAGNKVYLKLVHCSQLLIRNFFRVAPFIPNGEE